MQVIRINKLDDLQGLCLGAYKFFLNIVEWEGTTNYHIYLLWAATGGLVEFADILINKKDPGGSMHSLLEGCARLEEKLSCVITFNNKENYNYFFVGDE